MLARFDPGRIVGFSDFCTLVAQQSRHLLGRCASQELFHRERIPPTMFMAVLDVCELVELFVGPLVVARTGGSGTRTSVPVLAVLSLSTSPAICCFVRVTASVIRRPEYRSTRTRARSLTAFCLCGYSSQAARTHLNSSLVKGRVGTLSVFGGLISLAGLVGNHPESWTNRKNVLRASSF